MRFRTTSLGVAVFVMAFPIAACCARADGAESAKLSTHNAALHASSCASLVPVRLPIKPKVGLGSSKIHPRAPMIHTRPTKKKSSWWPFGRK